LIKIEEQSEVLNEKKKFKIELQQEMQKLRSKTQP